MPSGLNTTLVTTPVCSSRLRKVVPAPRVPNFRVSGLAVGSAAGDDVRAVRAEYHARDPALECPWNSSRAVPVLVSHTLTVWSLLPETIRDPSGLNATLVTSASVPFQFEQGHPLPPRPTPLTVWSLLPETICDPRPGLNADAHHRASVPPQYKPPRV